MVFTKLWALDASERALKTAAQTGLIAIGASEAFNLFSLDVKNFAGFALGGAFLSLLMSIASAGDGGNSASLVVDAKVKK